MWASTLSVEENGGCLSCFSWLEDFCEEDRQRLARDRNQGETLALSTSISLTWKQKWITNGTMADYFTVGCRRLAPFLLPRTETKLTQTLTSEKGMVVLVIERGPGIETKPIKTSYSPAAGKPALIHKTETINRFKTRNRIYYV
jgi:hypothetical protein